MKNWQIFLCDALVFDVFVAVVWDIEIWRAAILAWALLAMRGTGYTQGLFKRFESNEH